MTLRRLVLPLLLAFPLVAGCKQSLNERCQVDSDCDSGAGLVCVLPQGGSPAEGGLCQLSNTAADMTVVDSATAADEAQAGDQAQADQTQAGDQAATPDLTALIDLLAADGGTGD